MTKLEGHLENMAYWANPKNERPVKPSHDDATPGTMQYLEADKVKTFVYLLRACDTFDTAVGPKITDK